MNTLSSQRKKAYNAGLLAEQLAVVLLRLKGFHILSRRYKTKWGEIDIVASKKNQIHFIEVKKRDSHAAGLFSINQRQCDRIEKTALYYLAKSSKTYDCVSLDVIIVASWWQIKHIKAAWIVRK